MLPVCIYFCVFTFLCRYTMCRNLVTWNTEMRPYRLKSSVSFWKKKKHTSHHKWFWIRTLCVSIVLFFIVDWLNGVLVCVEKCRIWNFVSFCQPHIHTHREYNVTVPIHPIIFFRNNFIIIRKSNEWIPFLTSLIQNSTIKCLCVCKHIALSQNASVNVWHSNYIIWNAFIKTREAKLLE